MLRIACCTAALVLVHASCGERRPPALDGAADWSAPPQDGGDGPARRDLRPSTDAMVNHALYVGLFIKQFFADCMPVVPADPVQLSGHVEALNNGTTAVGPLQFSGGLVAWPTGGVVATFDVKPIAAVLIKPGEGLSAQVDKVSGSWKGGNACGVCGKAVVIQLAYTGAGLPAGSIVSSAKVNLSCGL